MLLRVYRVKLAMKTSASASVGSGRYLRRSTSSGSPGVTPGLLIPPGGKRCQLTPNR